MTTPPFHSSPESLVFDREGVLDRLMGGEALAAKVTAVFTGLFPGMMTELRRALDAADAPVAQRQAHSIKGAAANVGANALSVLALQMEQAAKEGKLEEVRRDLESLQSAFDAFLAAVRANPFSPE